MGWQGGWCARAVCPASRLLLLRMHVYVACWGDWIPAACGDNQPPRSAHPAPASPLVLPHPLAPHPLHTVPQVYLNLVLEYVPDTVYRINKHYTKNEQRMPIILVKLYTYQMLRALAHIHAIGVCHRWARCWGGG